MRIGKLYIVLGLGFAAYLLTTLVCLLTCSFFTSHRETNATDEDFQDDEKCVDYLHRFKTIKLLQEVQEKVGDKQESPRSYCFIM